MFRRFLTFTALSAFALTSALAKVQYGGINIAGFDFGASTDGTASASGAEPPLKAAGNGIDGVGQMQHFVTDDKLNAFRLPVSWQYLTNNAVGPLDSTNAATYDELVQGCLATGAICIIDVGTPLQHALWPY